MQCNDPAIEDEKHFLLNCSFSNDIRKHFFYSMELPIDWTTLGDSERLKYIQGMVKKHTAKKKSYLLH